MKKKLKSKKHSVKEIIDDEFQNIDYGCISDKANVHSRADYAAGPEPEYATVNDKKNYSHSSSAHEPNPDMNLETNGSLASQQKEDDGFGYCAESSSRISQLRQKKKRIEEGRESLRSASSKSNSGPARQFSETKSAQHHSSEEKPNEGTLDESHKIIHGDSFSASTQRIHLNQQTKEHKSNNLKKPPPMPFQFEEEPSERAALSAKSASMPRNSQENRDETKPGAVRVASPVRQEKNDERVGAFNYGNSPSFVDKVSPFISPGDASDGKVRYDTAAESYEASSTGACVFGGEFRGKSAKNVSIGPSLETASESYTTYTTQLQKHGVSKENRIKIQNYMDGEEFSSSSRYSEEEDEFPTISAVEVQESDIENSHTRESAIRQQIIDQSVWAVEMVDVKKERRKKRCLIIIFIVVVIGIVLGLILGMPSGDQSVLMVSTSPSAMPSSTPTETILPTLEHLALQGKLRCGVYNDSYGFSTFNDERGMREGIDADLCRAVAAAVFGDPDRAEFVVIKTPTRFSSLANRSIDLLAAIATHTMERDVNEKSTQTGFTFTVPYLYDGLGFGGDPKWVDCADRLDYHHMNGCRELRICVDSDSSHEFKLRFELFPDSVIISTATNKEVLENIISGMCNVVAGESAFLSHFGDMRLETANYTGEYVIGNNMFSKEPLALVTRQDDPLWSGFVNHVLQALMAAERENITQSSADSFYNTTLFGDEYESMFINAIKAVGNFAELHDRNLKGFIPRDGLNLLNIKGDTGLIYSFPFGDMLVKGAGPTKGGTLEKILSRKHMICGISKRTGFGEYNPASQTWNGLDADFCRALAAGIFVDYSDSNVVFKELNETSDRFNMLADDEVDVMAGGSHTHMLSTDILEPTRGEVFIFSTPYFYESVSRQANETEDTISMNAEDSPNFKAFSLVTREDDPQWSDFVNWVVESTFYAEENGIRQVFYINMPLRVLLFGPEFEHMMQSAIKAVGNYGEIYARNIEKVHPRSNTRNMLNSVPFGPQISPLI